MAVDMIEAGAEGGGEQTRGDVDDRDHALVGHARRTDHADGADDLAVGAVDLVGRGDHAALVERRDAGFAADEDLHAVGARRQVEQLHQAGALLEQVEQLAQPCHVGRQILAVEQVPLTRDDVLRRGVGRGGGAGVGGGAHQLGHVAAQLLQLGLQPLADLHEVEAGEVLRQIVGGLDQFARRVGALRQQQAVLHLAFGGDDDQQDAGFGQRQELDLADARRLPARGDHHAGEVREFRDQLRGMADHAQGHVGEQCALDLGNMLWVERPDGQQRVDEQPVAARRRHAAGRGMRAGDEAHLLEIGHHVADRRRRQLEAGILGKRA